MLAAGLWGLAAAAALVIGSWPRSACTSPVASPR